MVVCAHPSIPQLLDDPPTLKEFLNNYQIFQDLFQKL